MPEITVDFNVYCGTCGEGLCSSTSVDQNHGRVDVTVDVCPACTQKALQEVNKLEDEIESLREEVKNLQEEYSDAINNKEV